jgi:hypothetical protein
MSLALLDSVVDLSSSYSCPSSWVVRCCDCCTRVRLLASHVDRGAATRPAVSSTAATCTRVPHARVAHDKLSVRRLGGECSARWLDSMDCGTQSPWHPTPRDAMGLARPPCSRLGGRVLARSGAGALHEQSADRHLRPDCIGHHGTPSTWTVSRTLHAWRWSGPRGRWSQR